MIIKARALVFTGLVLLIFLTVVKPADSLAEMTAAEMMEKNFYANKVNTLTSDSTMILINDKGQKRERKTTTTSKLQKNGIDSKLLIHFLSPADIRGTGFLQIEHSEGEDDLWIYLPALKKSRRLVANNKKDSFVGSDFSYGDILLPRVGLYRHSLLRSENIDGRDCYVIESVPGDETVKRDSGYSKKVSWIRKDNFVESKVVYYDLSGTLLKTQTTRDHKEVDPENNRWIVMYREMENHQTGHKTIVTFDRIEANHPVADDLFTVRNIEKE